MKQNPKPLIAYAIIRKDKPKLKLLEIYDTPDIETERGEMVVAVVITVKE